MKNMGSSKSIFNFVFSVAERALEYLEIHISILPKQVLVVLNSLSLAEPQVPPPESGGGLIRPVRDDHHSVPPDGPQQSPHRVEGPGQLSAEPVPLLEDDDEDADLLQVGEEPDQVLQVVKAGVEARRVDDSDGGCLSLPQPGGTGV